MLAVLIQAIDELLKAHLREIAAITTDRGVALHYLKGELDAQGTGSYQDSTFLLLLVAVVSDSDSSMFSCRDAIRWPLYGRTVLAQTAVFIPEQPACQTQKEVEYQSARTSSIDTLTRCTLLKP